MVLDHPSIPDAVATEPSADIPLFSGEVLIVEDNFIIAMDVEELVTELGATAVHLSMTCDDALAVIAQGRVTSAILDLNIKGGTSIPIADELARHGIRFVFATGYSGISAFPERHQARPMLKKPYSRDEIAAVFNELRGHPDPS